MLRPILGRREEWFWWGMEGTILFFHGYNISISKIRYVDILIYFYRIN